MNTINLLITIFKKTITYNLPYHLRKKIKRKTNPRLLRNTKSIKLHQPINNCSKYERKHLAQHQQLDVTNYPRNLEIKI